MMICIGKIEVDNEDTKLRGRILKVCTFSGSENLIIVYCYMADENVILLIFGIVRVSR